MRRIVLILVFLWCALPLPRAAAVPAWEDGEPNPANLEVTVWVFGPGPLPETWWGHIALEIRDKTKKQSLLYNWGMFAFTENLVRDFLSGKLWFWVERSQLQPSLAMYRREGRLMRALDLNLSDERKLRLVKAVANNMLPENHTYLYDYFRDNCSTRIRDLIDDAIDGQLRAAATAEPAPLNWRDQVHRYMANHFWGRMVYNFLLGRSVDKPISRWDEMFLPVEFGDFLAKMHNSDKGGPPVPLVSQVRNLQTSRLPMPPPERPASFPWDMLTGLALAAIPFFAALVPGRQRMRKFVLGTYLLGFGVFFGFFGAALCFMVVATGHKDTHWNENLLLMSPLTFALCVAGWRVLRDRPRAIGFAFKTSLVLFVLALANLPLKWIGAQPQDNFMFLAGALPAYAGITLSLWCAGRKLKDAPAAYIPLSKRKIRRRPWWRRSA